MKTVSITNFSGSALLSVRKSVTALALSLAFLGSSSFAAQQVQEESFDSAEMGYTLPLSIYKFNTANGTLNSVKFEIAGTIEVTLTVFNQTAENKNYDLNTQATFRAQSETGTSPTWIFATVTPFSSTSVEVLAGDTEIFNRSASSSAESTYSAGNAAIADFTANGLEYLTIYFRAQNLSSVQGDGTFTASTVGYGAGSVKVTYDYTPVPEPGTWAVMALGAGLLMVSAKYRRRA